MQKGLLAAAGLGSIIVALSGCGIIGGSSTSQANAGSAYGGATAASTSGTQAGAPMQAGTALKIEKTRIGNVLANSRGLTLYWFSKDVRGLKSVCTGQCLAAWPALTGQPLQPSGVKLSGVLGTLDRADGTVQATYNGYPLYTYADDKAPGQVTGNGQGGVWHVITGKVLTSMMVSLARAPPARAPPARAPPAPAAATGTAREPASATPARTRELTAPPARAGELSFKFQSGLEGFFRHDRREPSGSTLRNRGYRSG